MAYKHIVTSGCSFSARPGMTWPYAVRDELNVTTHVMGCPSAGNTWIATSAIYKAQMLLEAGVPACDILMIISWSSIDRLDVFVDSTTIELDKDLHSVVNLPENSGANPANFHEIELPTQSFTTQFPGYVLGSAGCTFKRPGINTFKRRLLRFYTDQGLAITSYDNFLRLQWFCQSKGITLVNHTFSDLMHYPASAWTGIPMVPTKDTMLPISELSRLIDWNTWIFWKDTAGIYEYVVDNALEFQADQMHPAESAYKHYVSNHLLPIMRLRGFL